jgi:hypothetical protein
MLFAWILSIICLYLTNSLYLNLYAYNFDKYYLLGYYRLIAVFLNYIQLRNNPYKLKCVTYLYLTIWPMGICHVFILVLVLVNSDINHNHNHDWYHYDILNHSIRYHLYSYKLYREHYILKLISSTSMIISFYINIEKI